MINVLIWGGGLQGLSVAHSLQSHCCITAISLSNCILNSKFINYKFKHSINDYDFLMKVLQNKHYDIIIPMGDKTAEYLSENKEFIEKTYETRCAVADYSSLKIVVNKASFMQFCLDHDIPCPKTISLSNTIDEQKLANFPFPAMIKPNTSVGARGITKVNDISDLKTKLPDIQQKFGDCSLQEYINNKEYYYNVMMYRDSEGKFLEYAIIKIVRFYPIEAGSSTCCISVENEELLDICKDALTKLNWHGMADFDVLQRKDTGEYKIIEINPRVPASLRAAAVSGVNFPLTMVSECLGQSVKSSTYEPGKVLRYLGTDLLWFLKSKNRLKNSPSWFHFWGANIFYQDVYLSDPQTWISWLSDGLKKFFTRFQSHNL